MILQSTRNGLFFIYTNKNYKFGLVGNGPLIEFFKWQKINKNIICDEEFLKMSVTSTP